MTSVKSLFEASVMSWASLTPMKAIETAPKVSTVGYQMVDSIHCSQMARKPVRAP